MDTLFEMNKYGKSYRGNNCFQLLVKKKGFILVILMNKKGEVFQVVKKIEK